MSDNITRPTEIDPVEFLAGVATERQRGESLELLELMREVTGVEPVMWGPSIIGFGEYHYRYASGREGDSCVVGFAPGRGQFAIYNLLNLPRSAELLERLGPSSRGAGCLYVKKLADVDREVLRELITLAWDDQGRTLGAV